MDGLRPLSPPATDAGRIAALAVTALVITTVIGSELAITRWHFEARPEVDLPGWALIVCLTGLVVIVGAAWTLHVRVAAMGMAIAAIGALVPIWSAWSWMPATLRVAVLAVPPLVIAGLVRVVTATAPRLVDALTTAAVVVHLAGYDAFADRHCLRTCADVRPPAGSWVSTGAAVGLSTAFTVGAAVVAAVIVLRRRMTPRPTAAGAVVALVSIAVAALARWFDFADISGPSEHLVLVPTAALALVAATMCIAAARTWRTRVEVRRLVDRLSESAAVPHVAAVDVQFALPDGRWVDAAGGVAGGVMSDALVISDEAGPAIRLVMSGRSQQHDVLAALTPAALLALRNARLSAIAQARVADLQASRRRIVVTADAERRRIERDLHDGAQQRLVSATLHLQAAIPRASPDAAAELTRADAATRQALASLRAISHGIFPSALATEGLAGALGGLIGSADIPATLQVTGDLAVDAETAMAAYATVATALHGRGEAVADISVVRRNGAMTVTVEHNGVRDDSRDGADLTDLADRVGAVRGELSVMTDADRTTITAVLPCGS